MNNPPSTSPWKQLFGLRPLNAGVVNGLQNVSPQNYMMPMFSTVGNGEMISSTMQPDFPSQRFPFVEPCDMVSNNMVVYSQQLMQQQAINVSVANGVVPTMQFLPFVSNQPIVQRNQQLFRSMETMAPQTGLMTQQAHASTAAVTYLTPSLQTSAVKEAEIFKKIDDRANKLIHLMERMQTTKSSSDGKDSGVAPDDAAFYRKHYVDAAKSVTPSTSASETIRGPPVHDARQVIASKKRDRQTGQKQTPPSKPGGASRLQRQPPSAPSHSNLDEATGRKKRVLTQTQVETTPPPPPPIASLREREQQLDAAVVSDELLLKSWGRGMNPSRVLAQLPTDAEEQQLRQHLERRIAAVRSSTDGADNLPASSGSDTDVLDMRQYVGGRAQTFLASVVGKSRMTTAATRAGELIDVPDSSVPNKKPDNVFLPDAELEILYDSNQPKSKKPKISRLGSSMPRTSTKNVTVLQHVFTPDGLNALPSLKANGSQNRTTSAQPKSVLPPSTASERETSLEKLLRDLRQQHSISHNNSSPLQNSKISTHAGQIKSVKQCGSSAQRQPSQTGASPAIVSTSVTSVLPVQTSFAQLPNFGRPAVGVDLAQQQNDDDEYSPTMHSPASCAVVDGDPNEDQKLMSASVSCSASSVVESDDRLSTFVPDDDDEMHPQNIVYPPAFDYTSWREIAHNVDIKLIGMSFEPNSNTNNYNNSSKSIAQTEQNLANSKTEMHDARQALLSHRLLFESIDSVIQVRRNECFMEECKLQAMEGRVRKMEHDLAVEKIRLEAQRKSLQLPRGLLSFAERERELAEKRESVLLHRMQAAQQRCTVLANELRDARQDGEDAEAAMTLNAEIVLSSSTVEPPSSAAKAAATGSRSFLSLSSLAAVSNKPRSRAMFFDSLEQVGLQRKALLIGRMLRPGDEDLEDKSFAEGQVRQFVPDFEPTNELLLNNSRASNADDAFAADSIEDVIRKLDEQTQRQKVLSETCPQERVDGAINNDYWQNYKWYRLERCLSQLTGNFSADGADDEDMLLMTLYADINQTAESVWSIDGAGAVLFDTKWWDSMRDKALLAKLQLSTPKSAIANADTSQATPLSSSPVSVALMVHIEQLLIFDLLLYSLVLTLYSSSSADDESSGNIWPFFTTDYSRDAVLIDKLFDEKLDEVRRLCAGELDVIANTLSSFRHPLLHPNVAAADTRNELANVRGMRHAIAKFTVHIRTTTTTKKSAAALWWRLYEFERPVKKRTRLFRLISACRRILLREKSTARLQKRQPAVRRPAGLKSNDVSPQSAAKLACTHSAHRAAVAIPDRTFGVQIIEEICDVSVTSSAVCCPPTVSADRQPDDPAEILSPSNGAEIRSLMDNMLTCVETDCIAM